MRIVTKLLAGAALLAGLGASSAALADGYGDSLSDYNGTFYYGPGDGPYGNYSYRNENGVRVLPNYGYYGRGYGTSYYYNSPYSGYGYYDNVYTPYWGYQGPLGQGSGSDMRIGR